MEDVARIQIGEDLGHYLAGKGIPKRFAGAGPQKIDHSFCHVTKLSC
jgi:hypothetical protein